MGNVRSQPRMGEYVVHQTSKEWVDDTRESQTKSALTTELEFVTCSGLDDTLLDAPSLLTSSPSKERTRDIPLLLSGLKQTLAVRRILT